VQVSDRLPLSERFELARAVIGIRDLFNPKISGIEVTQGIQYYKASRHLTDPNDRGNDNSVRLVAAKPAWARVYVRSGILGGSYELAGELIIDRNISAIGAIWSNIATLLPQPPGTATAQSNPDYATERSTLSSSLNFIIPSDIMSGKLRIRARIWQQGSVADAIIDTYEIMLDVTLLQTLRLRGIMISYNGQDPTVNPNNPPTINLPAPTLADLQATAAWTLTTNPVQSQGIFSSAGTMQWSTPLTGMATNPGGCSTQWLSLNAAVAQIKANDGNRSDVIYYGLLPAGTPIQNVGGCESSGVSTGPNGRQVTMAHEVGHGAGLAHGPCGTPGDPNYPAYEPYDPANSPTASLGEYGLDINNGTIHPPAEKDYMSYCSPRWISLYHHARLINNAKFDPQYVGPKWRIPEWVDPFLWPWEYIPDPPHWEIGPGDLRMKAQKVISIIGVINEERQIQVQSVMRVMAIPTVGDSTGTELVAQLVGREGKVVASAPVMRLESHGCNCCHDKDPHKTGREPYSFQALVPDLEPGIALRIVQRQEKESDRPIWTRSAPDREPKIVEFNVKVARSFGYASWTAECSTETLEFSLQFSKDEGRSWNSLAVGIRENECKFSLSDLPSGPVIFRLLVHDGFFTSTMDSRSVRLPRRAPTISILHPADGSELISGSPLRLWAAVSSSTGNLIESESCVWIVDGKEAARGPDVWIVAPSRGRHECKLIVEDSNGRSETSVSFSTVSPDVAGSTADTTSKRKPTRRKPRSK